MINDLLGTTQLQNSVSMLPPDINKLVSSANIIGDSRGQQTEKSLI